MKKIFATVTALTFTAGCNTEQLAQSAYQATIIRDAGCPTYDYSCRRDNRSDRDAAIAAARLAQILAQ